MRWSVVDCMIFCLNNYSIPIIFKSVHYLLSIQIILSKALINLIYLFYLLINLIFVRIRVFEYTNVWEKRDKQEEVGREEGNYLPAKRIESAGRKNVPIFFRQKKLNLPAEKIDTLDKLILSHFCLYKKYKKEDKIPARHNRELYKTLY